MRYNYSRKKRRRSSRHSDRSRRSFRSCRDNDADELYVIRFGKKQV